MKENVFDKLIGEQLSSVTFVQDYLQIHFDGPFITLYIWPIVESIVGTSRYGEPRYRDEICKLITRKVSKTNLIEKELLEIVFEGKSKILISLNENNPELIGPEILNYVNSNQEMVVI